MNVNKIPDRVCVCVVHTRNTWISTAYTVLSRVRQVSRMVGRYVSK